MRIQPYGALLVVILLVAVVAIVLMTGRGYTPAAMVASPFIYTFSGTGSLEEVGTAADSKSPYWWLSSGGRLIISDSIGSTMQGDAPAHDPWREAYAASNPLDTDQGLHPQNLFRLVTRSVWGNASQEADMRIAADQASQSPNRNASNGLFLMSRYIDSNTLYYAGLRVDGMAAIKKKYGGTYYTLAELSVFSGTYDHDKNPNLLPHNEWISLRVDTFRTNNGVTIVLYMKRESDNRWLKLLEVVDHGQYGTPPIDEIGHGGIRTDFMDVEFRSYRMENV